MAELGDLMTSAFIGDQDAIDIKNIDVDMLDYNYIEKCSDIKKLKGILIVLESGKEGYYPHLIKTVQDKIFSLLSEKEKNKILRLKQQITPNELIEAENDLTNWGNNMTEKEIYITSSKDKSNKHLPPVRGSKSNDSANNKEININTEIIDSLINQEDKYIKQQLIEKDLYKLLFKQLDSYMINDIKEINKRSNKFKQEIEKVIIKMNSTSMTDVQKSIISERERLKGNEFYRSGDNQQAFDSYTISLAMNPLSATVYANRAMVSLKLDRFDIAEDDCSRALAIDPLYVKAWSRRGLTRFKKGRYFEAAFDFSKAIILDSNNKEFLKLFNQTKDKIYDVEGISIDLSTLVNHLSAVTTKPVLNHAVSKPSNGLTIESTTVVSRRVTIEKVERLEGLLFPSISSNILIEGMYTYVSDQIIEESNNNNEDVSYTRVAIIEEDEDDEEEENANGFTRIQITEEDDEEDEAQLEVSKNEKVSNPLTNPIVDEESQAVKYNKLGSGYLSNGKLQEALEMYSKSLLVDPTFIPSRNNRSFVYIQLKMYKDAIDDATEVLVVEPSNIKALYRRALSSYSLSNELDELSDKTQELLLSAYIDVSKCVGINSTNDESNSLLSSISSKFVSIIQRWKDFGNESLKSNDSKSAIDSYTKSINIINQLDGHINANALFHGLYTTRLILHNNRSQAYIKDLQYNRANSDTSYIIDYPPISYINIDEFNNQLKKAYYRRALARKSLGDSNNLQLAYDDLTKLYTLDSNNKQVGIERKRLEQAIKELKINKSTNKQHIKTSNPSINNKPNEKEKAFDNLDLKPIKTTIRKSNTSNTSNISNDDTIKIDNNLPTNIVSSNISKSNEIKETIPSKSSKKKDTTINVPKDLPKTEYEFETIYRQYKSKPNIFIEYLNNFKLLTLKKIYKNSSNISNDLLSYLLNTLLIYGDVEVNIKILESITLIHCFNMIKLTLPKEDVACINNIFTNLLLNEKVNSNVELFNQVDTLKQKYL